MRIRFPVGVSLSLLLLCGLCVPRLLASDPVDADERIHFNLKIERSSSGYAIESGEIHARLYRSARSLERTTFYTFASYFNKITKVAAELNGIDINPPWVREGNPTTANVFLDDSRMWTVELPRNPRIGDSLWYEIRREWDDPIYLPLFRVPNANRIVAFSIKVRHPEGMKIEFDVLAGRASPLYTITHPDNETTEISFTPADLLTKLAGYDHNGSLCYVRIGIIDGGVDVTKQLPRPFTKWYVEQFSQTCDLSDAQIGEMLRELPTRANGVDTLRCLHDFIRKNIRYVGDERGKNAYIPRTPSSIYTRRIGDCKDKAHLMSSVARKLGYNSFLSLINTEEQMPPCPNVMLGLFNHVICATTIGADTIFSDPTAEHAMLDEIPWSDDHHATFICDPKNPHWSVARSRRETADVTVDATVSTRDLAHATATVTLAKSMASWLQERRNVVGDGELSRSIRLEVGSLFDGIVVVDPEITSMKDSSVSITCALDLSNFVAIGNGRGYLTRQPIRHLDAMILDRETDSLPVSISGGYSVALSIRFKDIRGNVTPSTVDLSNVDGASYHVDLQSTSPSEAVLTARSQRKAATLSAGSKLQFLEYARSYFNLRSSMMDMGELK